MSNTLNPSLIPSQMPSHLHRIDLSSATAKLLTLELIAQSAQIGLPERVVGFLSRSAARPANTDEPSAPERLVVLVNVQALTQQADHLDEQTWKACALKFCVLRQAHFPLLRLLFDVKRSEVTRLRSALQAPPPPLSIKAIAADELDGIWRNWQSIQTTYERPIDHWVKLAEAFPGHPLNGLYQALVVDAGALTGACRADPKGI